MNTIEERMDSIRVLAKSVALPKRPDSFEGGSYKFPEDLTKLSGDELGALLSRLGAYRGYAQRQVGLSEIRRDMHRDLLSIKMPELISHIEKKGKTKTAIKEEARDLPEAIETRKKISEIDYIFKFYYALEKIYTGQIEVISREITRRRGI